MYVSVSVSISSSYIYMYIIPLHKSCERHQIYIYATYTPSKYRSSSQVIHLSAHPNPHIPAPKQPPTATCSTYSSQQDIQMSQLGTIYLINQPYLKYIILIACILYIQHYIIRRSIYIYIYLFRKPSPISNPVGEN